MARLSKDDLEDLEQLALRSDNVKQLRKEMWQELNNNDKSDRVYHPQPRYTPDGTKFFDPIKRTNDLSLDEKEEKGDAIQDKYDSAIRKTLEKEWTEKGYTQDYFERLDLVNMALLLDRGVDYTHQYMEDQEKLTEALLHEIEAHIEDIELDDLPEPSSDFENAKRDLDGYTDLNEFEPEKTTDKFLDAKEDITIDEPE